MREVSREYINMSRQTYGHVDMNEDSDTLCSITGYMMSLNRLLKIIGLSCRIYSLL